MGVFNNEKPERQQFTRYNFESWVDLKAIVGKPIFILDAWEGSGKFGTQLRFIFTVTNKEGTQAKAFATSTKSHVIMQTVLAVKKKNALPAFAVIKQVPAEKSPTGYAWDIEDVTPDDAIAPLLIQAERDARDETPVGDDASDLPDDLPF